MSKVPRVERSRPLQQGTEREILESMLDFYRATVGLKVGGLTDEQAFTTSVPPSTLTPATVVKHLAGTERFWFSIDFAGLDVPWPWPDDDRHGNFRIEEGDTLASIVTEYVAECERSRRASAGAALDDPARGAEGDFPLRYALVHMIQETARHCGHLDLLREATDGVTGQ